MTKDHIEYLYKSQKGKCFWCEQELSTKLGSKQPLQVSIDRYVSDETHTKDNCVLSCLMCNYAKNKTTPYNLFTYFKYLQTKKLPVHYTGKYDDKWAKRVWNSCKSSDQKSFKDTSKTLTKEQLKKMYEENNYSAYSKLKMIPSTDPYTPFQPSCERIDNSKPHSIDNCVLVCLIENHARNSFTIKQLNSWFDAIKSLKTTDERIEMIEAYEEAFS